MQSNYSDQHNHVAFSE